MKEVTIMQRMQHINHTYRATQVIRPTAAQYINILAQCEHLTTEGIVRIQKQERVGLSIYRSKKAPHHLYATTIDQLKKPELFILKRIVAHERPRHTFSLRELFRCREWLRFTDAGQLVITQKGRSIVPPGTPGATVIRYKNEALPEMDVRETKEKEYSEPPFILGHLRAMEYPIDVVLKHMNEHNARANPVPKSLTDVEITVNLHDLQKELFPNKVTRYTVSVRNGYVFIQVPEAVVGYGGLNAIRTGKASPQNLKDLLRHPQLQLVSSIYPLMYIKTPRKQHIIRDRTVKLTPNARTQ